MKKVAVFGNTGGGKSTLSKRLSEITGLPLYALDKIRPLAELLLCYSRGLAFWNC